jgi:hypothetical protein
MRPRHPMKIKRKEHPRMKKVFFTGIGGWIFLSSKTLF